jgi:hypothetical protein
LPGRIVGRAESLRRDETDDDRGRGGEPHDWRSMRGCLRTSGSRSIDDNRKFGCTRAVDASKIAEPGAELVVAAHHRSSAVSSRARAFLPRS